jgi:DNA adenine methylase
VKWVGGKGRLLGQLLPMLPAGAETMRHVEPFMGGAAMFFARRPTRALLCDVNPALVATYSAVRDDVDKVIAALGRLAAGHSAERYYDIRQQYNTRRDAPAAERAAMFIYLNKTCFNGLHRVNRRGDFNVPAGRYKSPRILDEYALRAAARDFGRADLRCQPFEQILSHAKPGDFIYFDPPYEPVSATASFTAYASNGFGREDQVKLRDVFNELDRRGCRLMLSNSDVPFIRQLYRAYKLDIVAAPRAVNCDPTARGLVSEVVVRNY